MNLRVDREHQRRRDCAVIPSKKKRVAVRGSSAHESNDQTSDEDIISSGVLMYPYSEQEDAEEKTLKQLILEF